MPIHCVRSAMPPASAGLLVIPPESAALCRARPVRINAARERERASRIMGARDACD